MEMCKHVETKFVPSGAILFRPGQTDDSIYVVRNGLLRVYIAERVTMLNTTNFLVLTKLFVWVCLYIYMYIQYVYVCTLK